MCGRCATIAEVAVRCEQRHAHPRPCIALIAIAAALSACTAPAPDYFEIPKPRFDTPVPFATTGDRLGVWNGREYQPLFIKGMNLNVAVPGTQAGELAATREQYQRWLAQIAAMGVNTIRIYALHYPRFYEELARYNSTHRDAPLYLLHGAWLDEVNQSGDLYDLTASFDANIREAIDCSHGNCNIPLRQGRAYGRYRADISQWVLGWMIGRDIEPEEITTTNTAHAQDTEHRGKALRLLVGTPAETWFAERLDDLILYERTKYRVERPVSVVNWPTLDPLDHSSESSSSADDSEQLDLGGIDPFNAPAGYFASYHAYPYYPAFMTRDAEYLEVSDREGPNSFFGYLQALKAHYSNIPLYIAEYGVPSSWANAHFGAAGMNHGGQDELQQAHDVRRLLHDTFDAQCAGAGYAAWLDAWWRRTVTFDAVTFPTPRFPLWHNVASPEQNFGLIAFELAKPIFSRWPATEGQGRIRSIRADFDAEYFHLRVQLAAPLQDDEVLTLGYDTYGDRLGESQLPSGVTTGRRNEFALQIRAPAEAQLYVMRAYDLYGIWQLSRGEQVVEDSQLFRSVASDTGDWVPFRLRNDFTPRAGVLSFGNDDDVGRLVVRAQGAEPSSREAVVIEADRIDIRIPWMLLQFTDPSTRTLMDDDRTTSERETFTGPGIAVSVQLGDELLETGRFLWNGWETAPPTVERVKPALKVLSEALRELN